MKEMLKELAILLETDNNSNNDSPYNKIDDKNVPQMYKKRKKVLKLSDINRLKKIRNQKREELAQDSVFVPILYGPALENPVEMGGDIGAGLPM